MTSHPDDYPDLGSLVELREQLTLFRECSYDHSFLAANVELLQKVLLRGINTEAVFHEGVETLFAVTPFIYRLADQSAWQNITWDALIGALNLKDGTMQTKLLNVLSRFHMLEGKHELARQNVERALARAQEAQDDMALLWAYIRFFELLVYQPADFSRHEVIEQVLALAEKVNQPRSNVSLHYALAHFYNRWEDYERALGHGEMAYTYSRLYRDNQAMTRAAFLLVGICRANASLATRHFVKVAEALDETKLSVFDQVTILVQQSALYYEMGKPRAAADGYQDAIDLLKHIDRPVHLAACLQGQALAQIRLREFDKAQQNLEYAGEIWQKHGSAHEHANYRFTQGYLEAWRGNRKFALRLLHDALKLADEIVQPAARSNMQTAIREFIEQVEAGNLDDSHRLE